MLFIINSLLNITSVILVAAFSVTMLHLILIWSIMSHLKLWFIRRLWFFSFLVLLFYFFHVLFFCFFVFLFFCFFVFLFFCFLLFLHCYFFIFLLFKIDPENIPGVMHMGFHSTGSFGATPYFIKREGLGNIMIDLPRFNSRWSLFTILYIIFKFHIVMYCIVLYCIVQYCLNGWLLSSQRPPLPL